MAARRRLDVELVRRGLVASRPVAREMVTDRRVTVNGAVADKVTRLVDPADSVEVVGPPPRYVSRGGDKLAGALDAFGIDPGGRSCLDAGASTGGFTDCLLQHGARHVTAVDVGHGQLHQRLREDPRVSVHERCDIRTVTTEAIGGEVELVVADLSFISLRLVLPALAAAVTAGGDVVVLVKPQFEAGRAEASRGRGVIRDPEVWARVLDEVLAAAHRSALVARGAICSPLRGGDGNVEFLVHLQPAGSAPAHADFGVDVAALVASVSVETSS